MPTRVVLIERQRTRSDFAFDSLSRRAFAGGLRPCYRQLALLAVARLCCLISFFATGFAVHGASIAVHSLRSLCRSLFLSFLFLLNCVSFARFTVHGAVESTAPILALSCLPPPRRITSVVAHCRYSVFSWRSACLLPLSPLST